MLAYTLWIYVNSEVYVVVLKVLVISDPHRMCFISDKKDDV